MGREEGRLTDLRCAFRGDAACRHKGKGLIQAIREVAIAVAKRAVGNEAQVPQMHLMQIRVQLPILILPLTLLSRKCG